MPLIRWYNIKVDYDKLKVYIIISKAASKRAKQKVITGLPLVAQWLRICLPIQGTRVRALVREDPTCHGAAKPVCHNCWACALEPASHNYWSPRAATTEACMPRARAPRQREATTMRCLHTATKSSPCSLQLEKACTQQRRPNAARKNKLKKKKSYN